MDVQIPNKNYFYKNLICKNVLFEQEKNNNNELKFNLPESVCIAIIPK